MAKRPLPSFLIFRDKDGNWRWNFAGPGGKILAASRQAYTRSEGCVRAIQLLKGATDAPVVGREADMKARESEAAEPISPPAGAAKKNVPAPKPGQIAAEAKKKV